MPKVCADPDLSVGSVRNSQQSLIAICECEVVSVSLSSYVLCG